MLRTNVLNRATANRSGSLGLLVLALATRLAGAASIAAAFCVSLASPGLARAAEPAARKVIAIHVEGPDGSAVRADIESVVPERLVVATAKEFSAALKKAGQTRPFGAMLVDPKQRAKVVPRIQQAAALIGAGAVVVGVVQNVKGRDEVYLVWVNADNDETPVDQAVPIPETEAKWHQALDAALKGAIDAFSPLEAPKKVETGPSSGEKKPEPGARVRHEVGSALASAEIGFEAGGRWFSYSDKITPSLRSYDVPFAPMLAIAGEVYPAAGTSIPVVRDLGISLGYARAFGLASATKDGALMKTVYQRFTAGLRFRVPFSRPLGPVLGASAGVLWQTFHVDELPALAGQIANVDYVALKLGVDGRMPLGRIALLAGFDYYEPFSAGEVYDRFTGAGVHGIGAMGGLVVRIAGGFEARVAGEYRRFFADFDPVLGDANVAGGALDQYMGIRLSGAYVE